MSRDDVSNLVNWRGTLFNGAHAPLPITPLMSKILIIEDDLDLKDVITDWLEREGHTVDFAANGGEGLGLLKHYDYELVILDLGLPDMHGLDVCKSFREQGGAAPILVLTGKGEVDQKIEGLDAGADDYLTKPFHPKELSARLRALIRRPVRLLAKTLNAGDITLDPQSRSVTKAGQPIHLLPKEYTLLEFFLRYPNEVFSQETILNRVWSSESEVVPDTVRFHIAGLRKKIDSEGKPSLIKTVHRAGYKLEQPGD